MNATSRAWPRAARTGGSNGAACKAPLSTKTTSASLVAAIVRRISAPRKNRLLPSARRTIAINATCASSPATAAAAKISMPASQSGAHASIDCSCDQVARRSSILRLLFGDQQDGPRIAPNQRFRTPTTDPLVQSACNKSFETAVRWTSPLHGPRHVHKSAASINPEPAPAPAHPEYTSPKKSTPAGLDQTDRGYAERCGDRGLGDPPGTTGKDTGSIPVPACCALSRGREHGAKTLKLPALISPADSAQSAPDRRQAHGSEPAETELACGGRREIDDPAAGEWPSVVDADHHVAAVAPVGDTHFAAER